MRKFLWFAPVLLLCCKAFPLAPEPFSEKSRAVVALSLTTDSDNFNKLMGRHDCFLIELSIIGHRKIIIATSHGVGVFDLPGGIVDDRYAKYLMWENLPLHQELTWFTDSPGLAVKRITEIFRGAQEAYDFFLTNPWHESTIIYEIPKKISYFIMDHDNSYRSPPSLMFGFDPGIIVSQIMAKIIGPSHNPIAHTPPLMHEPEVFDFQVNSLGMSHDVDVESFAASVMWDHNQNKWMGIVDSVQFEMLFLPSATDYRIKKHIRQVMSSS